MHGTLAFIHIHVPYRTAPLPRPGQSDCSAAHSWLSLVTSAGLSPSPPATPRVSSHVAKPGFPTASSGAATSTPPPNYSMGMSRLLSETYDNLTQLPMSPITSMLSPGIAQGHSDLDHLSQSFTFGTQSRKPEFLGKIRGTGADLNATYPATGSSRMRVCGKHGLTSIFTSNRPLSLPPRFALTIVSLFPSPPSLFAGARRGIFILLIILPCVQELEDCGSSRAMAWTLSALARYAGHRRHPDPTQGKPNGACARLSVTDRGECAGS